MAIIKDFSTPQGITASYHKIIRVEVNAASEALQITLAIFANAQARAEGKTVLWHEYVTVPFSDLPQDPRVAMYQLLDASVYSYLVGGAADV